MYIPIVIGKSSCWFVSAYFFFTNNSPANRCATIPGFNGGTHGSSPRTNGSSPRCSQGAPKAAGVPLTAGFSFFFFFFGNSPRKYGYTAIHDIVIIDDNLTKIEMMFSTRNLTKISYFIGELIWFTVPRYTHFFFGLYSDKATSRQCTNEHGMHMIRQTRNEDAHIYIYTVYIYVYIYTHYIYIDIYRYIHIVYIYIYTYTPSSVMKRDLLEIHHLVR